MHNVIIVYHQYCQYQVVFRPKWIAKFTKWGH